MVRQVGVYTLANVLASAQAVIVVPILTRSLSPADYGLFDYLVMLMAVTTVVGGLGVAHATLKYFKDLPLGVGEESLLGTALAVCVAAWMMTGVLLWGGMTWWPAMIPRSVQPYLWLMWVLILVDVWLGVAYQMLRAKEMPLAFLAIAVMNMLGYPALVYTLVVLRGGGLHGLLVAKILVGGISIGAASWLSGVFPSWRLTSNGALHLLRFGLPLVPAGFFYWALELSDRWFLQYFRTQAEMGLYGVAWRYASLMMIVVMGFQTAWSPTLMRLAKEGPAAIPVISRVFTGFNMVRFARSAR